MSRKEAT
jgi:hypothetical protein